MAKALNRQRFLEISRWVKDHREQSNKAIGTELGVDQETIRRVRIAGSWPKFIEQKARRADEAFARKLDNITKSTTTFPIASRDNPFFDRPIVMQHTPAKKPNIFTRLFSRPER